MSDKTTFIDEFVADSLKEKATDKLNDLITKYNQLSVISYPSEHSGEDSHGCTILGIGEDWEYGLYAVTGDVRKATKAVKDYLSNSCGVDADYVKEALDTAEKMKMHTYTKPWEDGEKAEWYWYEDHSTDPKAEWVVKFKLEN